MLVRGELLMWTVINSVAASETEAQKNPRTRVFPVLTSRPIKGSNLMGVSYDFGEALVEICDSTQITIRKEGILVIKAIIYSPPSRDRRY
jgi:hypothetical protein